MKDGGGFEQLLKKPQFTAHIIGVVVDEAHCVSTWGEFHPQYKELGRLRYILPDTPFLIASATLSSEALQDIKRLLHLWSGNKIVNIHHSTDRPNIRLAVKPIQGHLQSYADLAFLVPDGWKAGDPPPPKFLIFFDNIATAIEAAQSVRARLPADFRHKIKWFNADMSVAFKSDEVANFEQDNTWGFFTTESFGMVSESTEGSSLDLPTSRDLTCLISVSLDSGVPLARWPHYGNASGVPHETCHWWVSQSCFVNGNTLISIGKRKK